MAMTSADQDSMRRIYGSALIIGAATLAAILVGVARSKILALWVGPAGIGLIGVLNSVITFAAAVMHLGLARSGTHRIATHRDDPSVPIRSLLLATWFLAASGALLVWLLRDPISRVVMDSPAYAAAVGIASLGVALLIISGSQLAILQGLRRIHQIAQVRVAGAIIGSLLALLAVYYFGASGLAVVVVAIPLGDVLIARFFVRRLDLKAKPERSQLRRNWSEMIRFGLVTMAAGVMTSSTLVFVRASLVDSTGLTGAGLYQAAYSISVMNVALVLTALAADFFPALTSIIKDRVAAIRLVNQQFHVTLLLGTPLLLGIASTSPYVLSLLYSREFEGAALVMQLHTIGDLFKLLSWTLGAVLLATKDVKAYLAVEATFTAIYVLGTAALVERFGVNSAGIAYCLAYVTQSMALLWLCKRRHGLIFTNRNLAHFGLIAVAQAGLLILTLSGGPTLLIGLPLAIAAAVIAAVGMARTTGWHHAFAAKVRAHAAGRKGS